MRKLTLAGGFMLCVLGFGNGSTAHADPYKWCADYGTSSDNGTNCYFLTRQQCQAAISGNGGFCRPNPFYTGQQSRRDH
jgi:hypothetical protein